MEETTRSIALPWTGERYIPEIAGDIALEHLHRYMMARELCTGRDILDIACGEGYGSAILAAVARRVIGVDIARDVVAHAEQKYGQEHVQFKIGSCLEIPLPNASIDVIVSFETLEHHDQHEAMMAEVKRVLRPGGLLIISSPDKYEYSVVPNYQNPYHVKELHRHEFEQLLRASFKNVTLYGQRIVYGSAIFPEAGPTKIFSYQQHNGRLIATSGIPRPIYLIAAASDAEIAEMLGSIFEQPVSESALAHALPREGNLAVMERDAAVAQKHDDLTLLHSILEDRNRVIAAYEAERQTFEVQIGRWLARHRNAWAPPTSWPGKFLGLLIRATRLLYEHGVIEFGKKALYVCLRRVHPRRWAVVDWFYTAALLHAGDALAASPPEYEPEMFPALSHPAVKIIAFYLPQFHPIPENDQWWGKGFTEWSNVSKAQPLFPGHYQPRLPGELGFYDLRLLEVMQRQIELAKQYGLYGFCFYLYWFQGKRLLEKPVEQFLAHPELDFPFCLCWANENWTRRWDGQDQEILMAQEYSPDDDVAFIRDVVPYLRDPRYIRIDDKPLLLVYNPSRLPDAQVTASRWRTYCRSAGIGEVFLAMAQTFGIADPRPFGFDAAVEFPPHAPHTAIKARNITHTMKFFESAFTGGVHDYADIPLGSLVEPTEYVVFKGVMPGWDNTPRRGKRATVFVNSSPQAFQTWLETVVQWTAQHQTPAQRLVFVNAWNEWAEGAYLEPDRRYGYAYLNATARALQKPTHNAWIPKQHTVLFLSHDACRAGAQILLLDLLGWIRDKTAMQPKILLGAGGVLEHAFREIADVLILDDLLAQVQSPSDLEVRLKEFCGPDIKLLYANTVVSGKYLEYLTFLHAPVLTHVHELQKSIEKFAGQQTMDKLRRYTHHYIAVSPAVYEHLRRTYHIRPEQMDLVYAFSGKKACTASAQRQGDLRATLRLDPAKIVIFGCGVQQWRKGPDLFVAVTEQLVQRGMRGFHCYWIGSRERDEDTDLEQHILERGLTDYVTFLGEKDDPQAYFLAGDIFLLPSREDPFPLVCLEAAACGLPILCFAEAGGMPDFVEHDAGFVVPYENTMAMADKLALLLTDQALRQTLGKRAREKFLARHTLDRAAPAILRSIRNVAGIAPAVSVIVPVYNHAPFLKQRLESIFQQTFQDLEVILLDDGSTDESMTILQEYASRPNVRLQVNTHNQGVFAQWGQGLHLATADLIWIAEDDDFCDPDFLETLLPFFTDPDTQLAYCNSHAVDAAGEVSRDFYLQHYYHHLPVDKWHQDYLNAGTTEVNDGLAIKNTIPNVSAVVFRKPGNLASLIPDLMQMRCAGDWLFYLHLLKQGKIGYSARSVNYHRRHPDSVVSRNARAAENTIPDYYQAHHYVLQHYDIAPEVFERMVHFIEQELRHVLPPLSDQEFRKLYDSQTLRRFYTQEAHVVSGNHKN